MVIFDHKVIPLVIAVERLEILYTFLIAPAMLVGSVQFIYFTYSQNIQINLLLQPTATVTKYSKELLITTIIDFDCKRDKIRID